MAVIASKQQGFSLLGALGAIIVVSVVLTGIFAIIDDQTKYEYYQAKADKSIEEIEQITQAAGGYLVDMDEWPDQGNECESAIEVMRGTTPTVYLRFIEDTSTYDTQYLTNCDDYNFNVELAVDHANEEQANNVDYAHYITNNIANSQVQAPPDDHIVIVSVPRPEEQPLLDQFLLIDGSRAMEGNLNMASHTILMDEKDLKYALPKFVLMSSEVFEDTEVINKPDCSLGGGVAGDAKILLTIHTLRPTDEENLFQYGSGIRAIDNGDNWQVNTTGMDYVSGIANTYCNYEGWLGDDR